MPKVVDIVQGFIGSGKTTLINSLIKNVFPNERILVVLTEWGNTPVVQMDSRITTYSWNCEKGFPTDVIRQMVRTGPSQRIIFEVNGLASGSELIDVLMQLANEDDICLGAKIAVFEGRKYDLLGESFKDILYQVAVNSDGFWINNANRNICRWLVSVNSRAHQSTGGDLSKWYEKVVKSGQRRGIKELILCIIAPVIMYLIIYLLIFN
ncbi:cobalamin biosynthesis protein CobW [Sporomusaceae bacterium FL31]|nr:cobalamin biosynthesis protein CobW [Sporomusaceae bacterium FL31]GCE34969.1 cobalamin biosynthesis protein CobW [Sporomusaceae bacterium]